MFGSLPGGSPQEMFILPLENVLSMDSQNKYASLALTNPYAHISNSNSPVPLSTYSGSPAPSDFSLPLHASHPQAQPLPQRVLETVALQVQAKSTMANLDVEMAAYTQGLANFDIGRIPLDMACPMSCLRCPRCRLTYLSICSLMHFKGISKSIRRTCPLWHRSQFHGQWSSRRARLSAAPPPLPPSPPFPHSSIISENRWRRES